MGRYDRHKKNKNLKYSILIIIIIVAVGGAFFLSREMPAPTAQVEKNIDNSKFNNQ